VIELLLEAERALSFGRVDRAEQLYQQVARNDPRNSIAVVGLARVALERRDDLGAYLLARRALGIDPENEAAQRLATRLEEVMRTRGDDVPATADVPGWPSRPSVVPPSLAPKPPLSEPPRPDAVPTVPPPAKAPPPEAPSPDAALPPAPDPKRRRRSILDRIRGR
jgi:hypothetical protein